MKDLKNSTIKSKYIWNAKKEELFVKYTVPIVFMNKTN